jgi:hypothetical protein
VWALRGLGLPILRYDLGLSAAVALSCAAATGAGSLASPAGGRWLTFAVEVAAVVLLWAAVAVVARRLRPPLAVAASGLQA